MNVKKMDAECNDSSEIIMSTNSVLLLLCKKSSLTKITNEILLHIKVRHKLKLYAFYPEFPWIL